MAANLHGSLLYLSKSRSLGTGIWFFGAKRPDYGTYNISIDGQSVPGNAQSQNASFQQLLGGQSGLANGPHIAVLTNTGLGTTIDLDSIVFDTQIGNAKCVFDSYLRGHCVQIEVSPAALR